MAGLPDRGGGRAADLGRERLERGYLRILADASPGSHAAERAAILLALVAGFQVMRQVVRPSATGPGSIADNDAVWGRRH